MALQAPFPYFGGKSSIAYKVWEYLGDVKHYMEPFCGSLAVLLNRPNPQHNHMETVNDADGHIVNVWRAIKKAPDAVAEVADYPVFHIELNVRRRILRENSEGLKEKLMADEDYYDARLAGYYIWAASCWIGGGLTSHGRPHLSGDVGIHKTGKRPNLADTGVGIHRPQVHIYQWMQDLADRLRRVRVTCGDWTVICNGEWQNSKGTVGIFFDPPYSDKDRSNGLYAVDSYDVAHDVRQWCIERGSREDYRIVLAGYYEEHEELLNHGWRAFRYKVQGGYGNRNKNGYINRFRETLFISPYCNQDTQKRLFD